MNVKKLRKPMIKPHLLKPKRRWTEKEEGKIIEYLIANQPIEVPTAKVYYTQLIDDLQMDLDPNLLRYKVQNMRRIFFKTMDFVKEARKNRHDEEQIKLHLQKSCKHFKKMRVIFSSFYQKNKAGRLTDAQDSHGQDDEDPPTESAIEEMKPQKRVGNIVKLEKTEEEVLEELDLSWISQPASPLPTEMHLDASHDPLQDLESGMLTKTTPCDSVELKKEYISLEYFRLEVEKEKLAITREKLAMERQKSTDECNYRILQLEQQERIKIHQIDREAEVKRYELALKYKDEAVKTEM